MNKFARVEWIGIRPRKGGSVTKVQMVEASTEDGLIGDHYKGQSGKRQLTFVLKSDLKYVADHLGLEQIEPEKTRRNLLIEGLHPDNLRTGRKLQIGDQAMIEITGPCHPCRRMNETIGPGAEEAMENKGGYTAKIINAGPIKLKDQVIAIL